MQIFNPTSADIGRRVIHRTGRRGVLRTRGGTMCDVMFDDGRLQLVAKSNLTWEPAQGFTDADANAPDSLAPASSHGSR